MFPTALCQSPPLSLSVWLDSHAIAIISPLICPSLCSLSLCLPPAQPPSLAMGVLRDPGRRLSVAFALLFFAAALGSGLVVGAAAEREEEARGRHHLEKWEHLELQPVARRRLVGPGSSPPTCRGRCGRCLPCRPVHVAIQPGRCTTEEYYPEAWRCKCGNKLFMP
ncbi:EPIDERMAL PATTERNING FACTOR-like protein 5 [Phoenix dactylifera]|uniref:Epidermal patterning factor-like protein n=1 Tax=Phoenix dactylifera TaxID=42345 RepID=A0A8B7BFM0_PHODC|nr:EPIDERMAL PATTERNING FACTOR-like protein 5 [Phoenix dactylifera]